MGTIFLINISESATVYVGLTGIVRKLVQKSMGMVGRILSIFFLRDEHG